MSKIKDFAWGIPNRFSLKNIGRKSRFSFPAAVALPNTNIHIVTRELTLFELDTFRV